MGGYGDEYGGEKVKVMTDCVFCKIVAGKLSSHKVYEDEHVIAILDHRPIHPGHCMVIPKLHVDYFTNLSDELACHIVTIGNRLGRRILQIMKPKLMRIGFVVHGYIPHVHYHVIPQHDEEDITSGTYAYVKDGCVAFDATLIPIADDAEQRHTAGLLATET